jgi:DNA polymerase (family X)
MDKEQVAAVLEEIATLLELQGENPFRCQAYSKAARAILQMEHSLAEVVAAGKLDEVPGIGETLKEKITTLVNTGKLPFYEELKQKVPPGMVDMLRLPGVGPKKIKALYDHLDIENLEQLTAACHAGTVAKLKGFGEKTQQKILEGIAFLGEMGNRFRLDQALAIGQALLEQLRQLPGVIRIELCGSLRRCRETIRDIDILISSSKPKPIMDAFVKLPQVIQVLGHGETKSSIMAGHESPTGRVVMNADLRVVTDEQFPFALNYFTGSKEHNVAMRQRAQQYGLKLNEYELAGPKKSIKCRDERDIYQALDLDYIAPELRENTGEIDAAAEHRLPQLIEEDDIQGTFHCHTTWSDGHSTLAEMAEAAKALGYKYLGIADHSQSLNVANGLTPARVRKQLADIDALNEKMKGIRIFKGTECDILADGRLDYNDQTLALFDYVVASVHTHFNLPESEMTARIIKAISHPRVTMLGHATGRLLLRREAYKLDLEAILKAAAKHGTMVEINAHPQRLDLDWIHCKRAKALGVKVVINPDAHSAHEIELTNFGVTVARRGWLEKHEIFNANSAAAVAREFATRKKHAGK